MRGSHHYPTRIEFDGNGASRYRGFCRERGAQGRGRQCPRKNGKGFIPVLCHGEDRFPFQPAVPLGGPERVCVPQRRMVVQFYRRSIG